MTRLWLLAAVAALSFVGVTPTAADLPLLIPREILFGNPERTNPQLSPDGKYLAYLAPDDHNVLQVWMRTLGQQDDRMLTAVKKHGIQHYLWLYDGEHVAYTQDSDGDENWHLYTLNIHSGITRDMTPFQGIQAQLVAIDPHFPHELLVGMNLKDRRQRDVYRINLKTGAVELDTENRANMVWWTTDAQFRVRTATATMPFTLMVKDAPDNAWKILRRIEPDTQISTVGFSAGGKMLYLRSSHSANTVRLLALDLATGKETVLADDPQYDVSEVFLHPTTRIPQAVAFYKDKLEWQVLDQSVAADFDALAKIRKGELSVAHRFTPPQLSGLGRRDLEDTTWLVSYTTDDGPVYYYAYNRQAQAATLLFSHQPTLEGLALAPMQPISYPSRDGLIIHGYLTTPVGVPAKNLPTVLLVHGGPWSRDTWGYHPVVQWLANRGYAVLQVNFRGSTGYGRMFLRAGNRQWGGAMHDDLIDGVSWIVQQGIADPKKIAIMGQSYGGYATLVGLTFTPDVFAAGVDLVGISNLVTWRKSVPPYWAPYKALLTRRVGDPERDEEFLKVRSPLFFVDRIKAPLLIAQGANDARVVQAESDQMVEAMRKANKSVGYIVYTDEGHRLARPENRLHFYAKTEEFLAKYLGGRFEPMGEMKGHSGVLK